MAALVAEDPGLAVLVDPGQGFVAGRMVGRDQDVNVLAEGLPVVGFAVHHEIGQAAGYWMLLVSSRSDGFFPCVLPRLQVFPEPHHLSKRILRDMAGFDLDGDVDGDRTAYSLYLIYEPKKFPCRCNGSTGSEPRG